MYLRCFDKRGSKHEVKCEQRQERIITYEHPPSPLLMLKVNPLQECGRCISLHHASLIWGL